MFFRQLLFYLIFFYDFITPVLRINIKDKLKELPRKNIEDKKDLILFLYPLKSISF